MTPYNLLKGGLPVLSKRDSYSQTQSLQESLDMEVAIPKKTTNQNSANFCKIRFCKILQNFAKSG